MNAPHTDLLPPLLGGLLLLLLNGLLVALELALVRVRFSHFQPELVEKIRQRAPLQRLINHADATVRLARFGIALCALGYAVLVFPLIAEAASWAHGQWGTAAALLAGALAFVLAASLYFVFGELVPRGLGLGYPHAALQTGRLALRVVGPMRALVRPLSAFAASLLRGLGVDKGTGLESLDIEAQIELGSDNRPLSAIAQTIFRNALNMRELVVSDVLLPRHQVQWMDLNDPLETNLALARSTGHTRFPLCDGDLDRCVGLVHIKDIFRKGGDLRRLDLRRIKRDIIRVSPDEPVEEALQKLLASRNHMALAVDEFRGAEGIITLERILELLVGDIRDEFDVEEDNIVELPDGEFSVSGLTRVYEVEQALDVEISNDDVSTFGGLITSELGRIPTQGEQLELEGLAVTVTEVDERRVIRTKVKALPRTDAEE